MDEHGWTFNDNEETSETWQEVSQISLSVTKVLARWVGPKWRLFWSLKTKQSGRLAQQKLTSRDSFRKETKQIETKQRHLKLWKTVKDSERDQHGDSWAAPDAVFDVPEMSACMSTCICKFFKSRAQSTVTRQVKQVREQIRFALFRQAWR